MTTIDHTEADYDRLRAELEALRTELAEFRGQLAGEVRTRRLVVVDDQGVERIFTTLHKDLMKLSAVWSDGDRDAEACMYAGDVGSEDCAAAGFEIWAGGDQAVCLSGDEQGPVGRTERSGFLRLESSERSVDRRMRITPSAITTGTAGDESGRALFQYEPAQR